MIEILLSWAGASPEGLTPEVADGIREVRTGAYMTAGMEIASSILTGTALYGTVRRVVWEDGGE